jgi:hypothetical protein
MEEGLEAIRRVTEKVNETQRQHENIQAVEDLKKRVDDWKVGSNLKKCHINLIDVMLFSGNQHRWLWQLAASRKGDNDKQRQLSGCACLLL